MASHRTPRVLLPLLFWSMFVAPAVYPCTTFLLARNGEALFGRNYDFEIGQGYVMTNHRGIAKTSVAGTLRWTSKHASITFNQWGREFPMDGMNESGLAVALMWLDGSEYPRDSRPALRVLEWIQYQLDNYATVAEVLREAEKTRIAGGTPLHYLIADATGAAATIEYLDGRLVVHTAETLPVAALTNDRYDRSLAYADKMRWTPQSKSSLDRFARVAKTMRAAESVDDAFDILDDVAQPGFTRWSVVYDLKRREIHWVSDSNRTRKTIRLAALNLECTSPALMLNVHASAMRFEPYSAASNRQLVVSSYAQTSFTRREPREAAENDATHAESFGCAAR